MKPSCLIPAVLCAVLTSGAALAQPSITPPQPPPVQSAPEVEVQDYRWKLLVVDASWIVVGLLTLDPTPPAVGYLLAAPGVHLLHGNSKRFFASAGLRLLLPAAGLGLGLAAGEITCRKGGGELCGLGEIVIGTGLGVLAAVIIDATILGRVEKRVTRPALIQAGAVTANPMLGVDRGGRVSLGLSGSW